MRMLLALAVLASVSAAPAPPAAPGLQGVWRAVEITYTGASARVVRDPQPGLLVFTQKHYSQVEITSDVPRIEPPDLSKATADELRGLWNPLRANAGEYDVSGDTFTKRALVAKNESTMRGAANGGVYQFRVDGNTLWTTLVRDVKGSVRDPFTTKYTRLE